MKKIISIFFVILLLFSLCACGSSGKAKQETEAAAENPGNNAASGEIAVQAAEIPISEESIEIEKFTDYKKALNAIFNGYGEYAAYNYFLENESDFNLVKGDDLKMIFNNFDYYALRFDKVFVDGEESEAINPHWFIIRFSNGNTFEELYYLSGDANANDIDAEISKAANEPIERTFINNYSPKSDMLNYAYNYVISNDKLTVSEPGKTYKYQVKKITKGYYVLYAETEDGSLYPRYIIAEGKWDRNLRISLAVDLPKAQSSSSSSRSSSSSGKHTCETCGGSGYIKYYYGSSDLEAILSGHDPYTVSPCYTCGGTGYVGN